MRKQDGLRKVHKTAAALLALGVAVFFIGGCVKIPLNYKPGSAIKISGNATVSDFGYLPAQNGKVKPFQISNTAWRDLKFKKDISVFFRDAVSRELRSAGVSQDGSVMILGGDIEEFLIDDTGYRAGWTLRVRYIVKDSRTDRIAYTSTKTTLRGVSKLADFTTVLNEIVRLNIEELLKDESFMKTIH